MGKRSSEHGHLSKEEYDAMQERSSPSEPTQGPFSRASAEQLKKRRIVRISGAGKWKSPAAATQTPGTLPTPAKNVFSGVKLQASAASKATPPPSSNPFANVSFASPVPVTATPSKKLIKERLNALNMITLQFFLSKCQSHPRSDLSEAANDYLGYCRAFAEEEFGVQTKPATGTTDASTSPFASTPAPIASATSKSNSTPFAGFSAPKSDAKSVSTPASTKPFTGFSFGASPAPSLTTPAAPTATASPKSDTAEKKETTDGFVKDPTSDWEVRYEVRAQYYKADNVKDVPKSYCTGPLRLETSSHKKHRMVMRNEAGKVQLNLAIVKDMPFRKDLLNGKHPGSKMALVSFIAQEDDGEMKSFKLRVKPENLDALHENLTKLASE